MIPINQSVVVTPLIYTHVTLYFISTAWLVDASWHMIFALQEKDLVHLRADWRHFNILIDGSCLLLSKLAVFGFRININTQVF